MLSKRTVESENIIHGPACAMRSVGTSKVARASLKKKLVRAKTRELILITDTPFVAFEKVSLDMVGKLATTPSGNRHIQTMRDNLSKSCIAVTTPNVKTKKIAHAVAVNLFSQYGAPQCILTDRSSSFISDANNFDD